MGAPVVRQVVARAAIPVINNMRNGSCVITYLDLRGNYISQELCLQLDDALLKKGMFGGSGMSPTSGARDMSHILCFTSDQHSGSPDDQ